MGEARQLFIIITPGLSANMKTKRQSRLSIRSEEPVREQRTCHEQLAQSAMSTMGGTSERDGKGAHNKGAHTTERDDGKGAHTTEHVHIGREAGGHDDVGYNAPAPHL